MNILNITIEPSSSNWWKQRQRPSSKHCWRVGGVRIWGKWSRPWWINPLKQSIWANGSSPTSVGLGRNQHRTKLVPLNVVDSCMAGADLGATGGGTRIYPYCMYWLFFNLFSLDTLLILDIVGRSLDFPQRNVPYLLWGMDWCCREATCLFPAAQT